MELVLALLACCLVCLALKGKTPRQTPSSYDEDEAFEKEWEAARREVEAELDDEWPDGEK